MGWPKKRAGIKLKKIKWQLLTELALTVAFVTVTDRILLLCGGVVFIVLLACGMLSLFTGVGGALSDRGREIPGKGEAEA